MDVCLTRPSLHRGSSTADAMDAKHLSTGVCCGRMMHCHFSLVFPGLTGGSILSMTSSREGINSKMEGF